MRDCDVIRERLIDFIEGELGVEAHRRIADHLDRCPHCSHEAHTLREVLERARTLPPPAAPADLLDGFSAAVRGRIALERPPRPFLWRRMVAWLAGGVSLRPIPALSAAAALGLLLAIGLAHTPRPQQVPPVPEALSVGESLALVQDLDLLEQFDLLEDLDLLEQLPVLRDSEKGRPSSLG